MADEISALAERVERFVREHIVPYETDPRCGRHGPSDELIKEMRAKARDAGVLTPHIRSDGTHLSQRQTARLLIRSGLSPLGPVACNTNAPDEGNMFLLGKVATDEQQAHYLTPVVRGDYRSCFLMTEPADDQGAGSDPSMLKTVAHRQGDDWIVHGRKTFITGFNGARVGILMANTGTPEKVEATMFLVDLPHPCIRQERLLDTIDNSLPSGHSVLCIDSLRIPSKQVLGAVGQGFQLAQVRLSPARLSHCMRWLGASIRAQEIATSYACRRHAFGRLLIDHEGVGFKLAENLIELRQVELMIDWCAGILDDGESGTAESSMTKAAAAEALFRVADRCVQVMGGTGVTGDTIVEQVFRELRAFRIYDGPTEVHYWSLAKKIKRDFFGKPGLHTHRG